MSPQRRTGVSLSKSRYFTGLRCPKKLYFEMYHPELAQAKEDTGLTIKSRGIQIGELARQRFPDGYLVQADSSDWNLALEETDMALSSNVPVLYEAAFADTNRYVRVDILRQVKPGRFHLIEVKSGSGLKPDYLEDVAFQYQVLLDNGITVDRVYVMCLNPQYIYEGGEYDLEQLFQLIEVTEEAKNLANDVDNMLAMLLDMMAADEPPEIRTGRHCRKPELCPFYHHCRQSDALYPVHELNRITPKMLATLHEAGIADIRDIPEGFKGINPKYWRVKETLTSGQIFFSNDVHRALKAVAYPVHFLDFETIQPALPLFEGTRPYEKIPFQWSLHILDEAGNLEHQEFLQAEPINPQRALAEALVNAVRPEGSLVVYHAAFERNVIIELARQYPDLRDPLLSMLDRIYDLLPCIEQHCYHPEFRGSYSIKKVLSALVPELAYNDLHIQNGQIAAFAYEELFQPDLSPQRRQEIYQALLAYCKRDTMAMVVLFQKLLAS